VNPDTVGASRIKKFRIGLEDANGFRPLIGVVPMGPGGKYPGGLIILAGSPASLSTSSASAAARRAGDRGSGGVAIGGRTVWKVLRRAGLSRTPRAAREPANSYEWPCPGDLLHMDTSEYARFQRPGHRVTGDRHSHDRRQRDGVDVVHAVVDDHSRLAYTEIHEDERAATVAGFLERALAFYAAHGISVRRLMTDG
jgi:hypothetical protein